VTTARHIDALLTLTACVTVNRPAQESTVHTFGGSVVNVSDDDDDGDDDAMRTAGKNWEGWKRFVNGCQGRVRNAEGKTLGV